MHYVMPNYHPDTLRYLLEIAKPDVLALEIRKKDLSASGFGHAPSDIKHIVIPWARKYRVPIRPIDWWKPGSRKKRRGYMAKLRKTEEGRKKLATLPGEMKIHKDRFPNSTEMTVSYMHSKVFANRDYRLRQSYTRILGEGPGNLYWNERAQKMSANLAAVVNRFPGKRIVVVAGAAHRGDFERALAKKGDVALLRLKDLPGFDRLPPYRGIKGGIGELKRMLVRLVQGRWANRFPDKVSLPLLRAVMALFASEAKRHQLEATLTYFQAEYHYLAKEYTKAFVKFRSSADHVTDKERLWGIPLKALAMVRLANMQDLLGKRAEALRIYKKLIRDSTIKMIRALAHRYSHKPFARP
jgi:hypothetical protein